jgi:hypothetical protein
MCSYLIHCSKDMLTNEKFKVRLAARKRFGIALALVALLFIVGVTFGGLEPDSKAAESLIEE